MAALNIVVEEPHKPERYASLLSSLFALKRPVRTHGDTHLTIAKVDDKTATETEVEGLLGRFTAIDPTLPWFDQLSFGEADADATKTLSIPANLMPNYRPFYFKLLLDTHTLVFETIGYNLSVSPLQVVTLLKKLCEDKDIVSRFGSVSITLIQDTAALNEIFGLAKIRTLEIEFSAPNADEHNRWEPVMQRRLQRQHIRRVNTKSVSDSSGSIQPDARTKGEADYALKHGFVIATGVNSEGKNVVVSSQKHPLIGSATYDPDHVLELSAFRQAAINIRKRVKQIFASNTTQVIKE